MGILRLLLALAVVIAHSSPVFGLRLTGGTIAVQAFYIISGFYMALILNEKYIGENKSYKLFISNRFLRLYPIYWVVLLLSVLSSLAIGIVTKGETYARLDIYIEHYENMGVFSVLFLIVSNAFIFFQDLIVFMGLDSSSGNLYFTSNFRDSNPMLFKFNFIPQAWTVGVELTFYLIAPFLARRKLTIIVGLILISIAIRIILYQNGLNYDPWTFRFFPAELVFFLFGIISYRIYCKIKFLDISKTINFSILIYLILFVLIYSFIPFNFKSYIFLLSFFIGIPFVFKFSKKWKKDRYIGELSYPIYISHILLSGGLYFLHLPEFLGKGFNLIFISILFAIVLNELVSKKIENLRQKRVK